MTQSEIFDPSKQSNEEASSVINSGESTSHPRDGATDENDDWIIESYPRS